MYRTPEMLDLYQNFPINEGLDIWVSGAHIVACHLFCWFYFVVVFFPLPTADLMMEECCFCVHLSTNFSSSIPLLEEIRMSERKKFGGQG